MGPVAQPVFKTGEVWQPQAGSVRLRGRSAEPKTAGSSRIGARKELVTSRGRGGVESASNLLNRPTTGAQLARTHGIEASVGAWTRPDSKRRLGLHRGGGGRPDEGSRRGAAEGDAADEPRPADVFGAWEGDGTQPQRMAAADAPAAGGVRDGRGADGRVREAGDVRGAGARPLPAAAGQSCSASCARR